MRKVVIFDVRRWWGFGLIDLDKLNRQIGEIEKEGWKIISVDANTFFGQISSFTILIEFAE